MMKEKFGLDKSSKIILSLFILYAIIMLAIFLPGYIARKGKLFIITNSIKIKYINGNWSNIEDDDDYRLKDFEFYNDSNYFGKYKVYYYNNSLQLYDNGRTVPYQGSILGYNGNISLEVFGTDLVESLAEVDKIAIREALNELKLSATDKINYVEKAQIDINGDTILDTLYCINNYYAEDNNSERFSIIFALVDNKIEIIDKVITTNNAIDDSKIFSIVNILDVKKDKKLELLYISNYPNESVDTQCAVLYNLNNSKVIKNFCN